MRPRPGSGALPALLWLGASVLSACESTGGSDAATWTVERDTVGDTVIVRTTGGSTWESPRRLVPEVRIGALEGAEEYVFGRVEALAVDSAGRIYVFDGQVPALRAYGPDGDFLRAIGREGSGPGEYRQPDAGLAVLPDGRILLRDPGNARINVYSPSGETLEAWPARGGYFTSVPLFTDAAGYVYTYLWNLEGPAGTGRGLIKYAPDGRAVDTLAVPEWELESATVSASTEGASQRWNVPFSPTSVWTWSPGGTFIGGPSTRYALDVVRPDGSVLRIERRAEPVPVAAGERAFEEERVRRAMRRLDPSWRWNGPPIPDTKPPFRRVYAGRDERIWVLLHTPGREAPAEAVTEESPPGEPPPPPPWVEPILFDVFEPDGRYLGQVRAPEGFQLYPAPAFAEEQVWAVVEDALGVESVVRFTLREADPEG